MKHPDYPGVSSFTDNRGAIRWRFRRAGRKVVYLPGEPHTHLFDAHYHMAVEGLVVAPAKPIAAPSPSVPRTPSPTSLDACWVKVQTTAKWKRLNLDSQKLYSGFIEEFLNQPLAGGAVRAGAGPVADFKARHVVAALDAWSDKPGKAKLLLIMLRKLMKVAMLQEWIEYDPTASVDKPDHKPTSKKAWPPEVCARFERRWAIGTRPRTAYELAKWLGVRRSDVATIRWSHLVTALDNGRAVEGFKFIQYKGRNLDSAFPKFHAINPMLAEALAPLSRETQTVLADANGQPYKIRSLSCLMARWCEAAGIPGGYSFHGLRHAMGAMLADADASEVQAQDVLGHATLGQQNVYRKERNQTRSAIAGMEAVTRLVRGS